MSQLETLQDIYKQIADIKDALCAADDVTAITTNIKISDTDYSATPLKLDNPDSKESITDAETAINKLITSAMAIAKDTRLPNDEVALASTGSIVPVPTNSPIALLPDLLKALLLYKLPLKLLTQAITDYLGDVLLEQIKRKLSQKTAKFTGIKDVSGTLLISIPNDVDSLIIGFRNLPDRLGKRFAPANINIDLISPAPSIPPDLAKYLLLGLGTINFGYALLNDPVSKTVFWGEDHTLRYARNIFKVPKETFSNYQRYAYLHCEFDNTATIGFVL